MKIFFCMLFTTTIVFAAYGGAINENSSSFKLISMKEEPKKGVSLALKYYLERDYKNAYLLFEKYANDGDVLSQYMIMGMRYRGYGITKNWEEAYRWMKKANAGLEQDKEKAFSALLDLAKNNDAMSQHIVSGMYSRGDGVRQDSDEAYIWELNAAEQCDTSAQIGLGIRHTALKEDIKNNLIKAHAWLGVAYLNGDVTASKFLQYTEERLDPVSLNKANILKIEYYNDFCSVK